MNKYGMLILSILILALFFSMVSCYYYPVTDGYIFRKPTPAEKKMFESYEKIDDPNLSQEEREMWMSQFQLDVRNVLIEMRKKYED